MPERSALIDQFVAAAGWGDAERKPLGDDASFRRYLRLTRDHRRAILMDAPPPMENVGAFHKVDSLLHELGLSAPKILRVDAGHGLMLLEDLGDRTFTRALAEGEPEEALYRLATDTLIALHDRCGRSFLEKRGLSPYDDEKLHEEALLLTDWYWPAVHGSPISTFLREAYIEAWQKVFPIARSVPDTLVLRDYHVDNLMILDDRTSIAACGLLDFQDAVVGPVTYDLVSLLEDARRDVSPAVSKAMLRRYLDAFPDMSEEEFQASYAVLGAQRSAKIIGIFTRLWRRDGKPQYLRHIPRVWRWLEGNLRQPALRPVAEWFAAHLPASERATPSPAYHSEPAS